MTTLQSRPGASNTAKDHAAKRPSKKPKRPLPWPIGFYRSAIGKKYVMAITGAGLMLFVIVHMIGNLKLYLSKEELNLYGEALRDMPGHLLPRTFLLWALRAGLIAMGVGHLHAAFSLTRMNAAARAKGEKGTRDYVVANYASRTMRWSGVIVLLFVAFHLADLTAGTLNGDRFLRGDPYNNLVYSFQRPLVAVIYVVANLALGVHLFHGAWSMFQSLGVNNPFFNKYRRNFAQGVAALIVLGNISFPVLVQAHVVEPECPGVREATVPCNQLEIDVEASTNPASATDVAAAIAR